MPRFAQPVLPGGDRSRWIFEIPLLACVVWLAHFFYARDLGLYEDDWGRIPNAAGMSWAQLFSTLKQCTFDPLFSQGRPLHPIFVYLFSYLGLKTGSLIGLYCIAFAIAVLNAFLFWTFLLRVFQDRRFAMFGALAFCLFPADTTQPFLTHALGLQTALTLLLLAFHLYLSGWEALSYGAIFLVLFNYETPYLVFAVAPLLTGGKRRSCLRHWGLLAGLLVLAVLVRKLSGEARVEGISPQVLIIGLSNIITGPLTCAAMYIYRPIESLFLLRGLDLLVTAVAIAGLGCMFLVPSLYERAGGKRQASLDPDGPASAPAPWKIGALMTLLAYPLTLTTKGISIAGRGTRVHSAAVLGAAILVAWAYSRLLDRTGKTRTYWPQLLLACHLGLLVGFRLRVQQDYALGWTEQREFWTDLVQVCPTLRDGDVVMVDPSGLRDTRQLLFLRHDLNGVPESRQIRSLDNVILGLPALYTFPSGWLRPQVFRLPVHWETDAQVFAPHEQLNLRSTEIPYYFDPSSRGPVDPSHVIFIDTKNGRLSRRYTLYDPLDHKTLRLNSEPGPIADDVKSAFFPYVISRRNAEPFRYLVR